MELLQTLKSIPPEAFAVILALGVFLGWGVTAAFAARKIRALRTQVGRLERENGALETERTRLVGERERLGMEAVRFRERSEGLTQRLDEAHRRIAEDNTRLRVAGERVETLETELEKARVANAALTARIEDLGKELERIPRYEEEIARLRETRHRLEGELERLRDIQRLKEEEHERKLDELTRMRESMQKEFRLLAGAILEENAGRFSKISKEGVEAVLKPLGEEVRNFRRRIEEVHAAEARSAGALMQELKRLRELNETINEEAARLSRALRSQSKTRGIWGEMVLERVLEASGLREGEEYLREATLRNEGERYRPDVIVRLPGGREVVIDAKTPLLEYERMVNASDEAQRTLHARGHLAAIRHHVEELSAKGYERLEGIESLDFVLLFVPIEGALLSALDADPGLFEWAFSRRVVLVSPTTLLVALKAIESTWRRERQNRNALEIARRAGALYDKFVGFVDDLQKLEKQIRTLSGTFEGIKTKLHTGKGNLVRQVEMLRELGAQTSKTLPRDLLPDREGKND
ncbi:DNA recombination protein RmuC [Nitratifractor sp.]